MLARATACKMKSRPVPAAVKIELVHRLQTAGLKEIEVTSFVSHPNGCRRWLTTPRSWRASSASCPAYITRCSRPIIKGFEAALLSKPDEIVVFGAASEAFSQKNINCSASPRASSVLRRWSLPRALRASLVRGAMSVHRGLSRMRATSPPSASARLARSDEGALACSTGRTWPTRLVWAHRSRWQRAIEATQASILIVDHVSAATFTTPTARL
jgi:hypothetical protein